MGECYYSHQIREEHVTLLSPPDDLQEHPPTTQPSFEAHDKLQDNVLQSYQNTQVLMLQLTASKSLFPAGILKIS